MQRTPRPTTQPPASTDYNSLFVFTPTIAIIEPNPQPVRGVSPVTGEQEATPPTARATGGDLLPTVFAPGSQAHCRSSVALATGEEEEERFLSPDEEEEESDDASHRRTRLRTSRRREAPAQADEQTPGADVQEEKPQIEQIQQKATLVQAPSPMFLVRPTATPAARPPPRPLEQQQEQQEGVVPDMQGSIDVIRCAAAILQYLQIVESGAATLAAIRGPWALAMNIPDNALDASINLLVTLNCARKLIHPPAPSPASQEWLQAIPLPPGATPADIPGPAGLLRSMAPGPHAPSSLMLAALARRPHVPGGVSPEELQQAQLHMERIQQMAQQASQQQQVQQQQAEQQQQQVQQAPVVAAASDREREDAIQALLGLQTARQQQGRGSEHQQHQDSAAEEETRQQRDQQQQQQRGRRR